MTGIDSIKTIGYGNRTLEEFLNILKLNRIEFLIDVRSVPFSKYKPEFSKPLLSLELEYHQIRYVFMGNELGGRPQIQTMNIGEEEPEYEEEPDYIDYNKVKDTNLYLSGIDRLCQAFDQNQSVVLMCSEGKPENCHRSKLIGQTLTEKKIKVVHIDENNGLVQHERVMERIPGYNQQKLFPDLEGFRSRKKYLR